MFFRWWLIFSGFFPLVFGFLLKPREVTYRWSVLVLLWRCCCCCWLFGGGFRVVPSRKCWCCICPAKPPTRRGAGKPASGEVSFAGKINEVYTLVNVYIAMENHHFNGKTHYKWPFSIAMLVYQRVDGGFVNCHCREPKFAEIWSFLEAGSHLNCTLWL